MSTAADHAFLLIVVDADVHIERYIGDGQQQAESLPNHLDDRPSRYACYPTQHRRVWRAFGVRIVKRTVSTQQNTILALQNPLRSCRCERQHGISGTIRINDGLKYASAKQNETGSINNFQLRYLKKLVTPSNHSSAHCTEIERVRAHIQRRTRNGKIRPGQSHGGRRAKVAK